MEWTDIKLEKPPIGKWVLFYLKRFDDIIIGQYFNENNICSDNDESNPEYFKFITHWMKLPTPPKFD